MIYFIQPQAIDGSLGKGYNHYINLLPKDSWAVITDYDTLWLNHPEEIILKAIKEYPDTAVFTCFTNRIKKKHQLVTGRILNNRDILDHYEIAKQLHNTYGQQCTQIDKKISGFCMIIKKSAWEKVPFSEEKGFLGIDDDFSQRILRGGLKIRRINGLYIFHYYRMHKSHLDTTHLK